MAVTRPLARPLRAVYGGIIAIASRPRSLAVALAVVFLGCSTAYGLIEHKGPIESMWWALVTGSTVGYGDFYPTTTAGRGVGAVLIVSMIVLVACVTANLTARLIPDPHQFTDEEQQHVMRCLAETNARLDRIERLLAGRPAASPDGDAEDGRT